MPFRARHIDTPRDTSTTARHFIFCTGIENSYPVITSHSGRRLRRDGMALSGHYHHWRKDFDLVRELGITFLRYGPPYYTTHTGPMRYDWDFADKTFARLRQLGIHPITDLCHFGVSDWVGDFQNPDWPSLFAEYAAAFARRFPWVRFYTPVNEIFIAARFSAELGWWNEQLHSDRAFVTALKHLAKANLLAEEAILAIQPHAIFIQSESSEYFHTGAPTLQARADFLNQKRFLSLDLCYGTDVAGTLYEFLLDNGMSRDEYHWFLDHGSRLRPHCVMGNDYYITNEHLVDVDGSIVPSGEIFGYYVITKQYFDRYRLPVMHTETNRKDEKLAPAWLWKEWSNILRLKRDGVPIIGFTWYSLIDQTDWDTALREDNHRINPLGLYDHKRNIRPVGKAYQNLIAQWSDELLLQSTSRDIAIHPDKRRPARTHPGSHRAHRRKSAEHARPTPAPGARTPKGLPDAGRGDASSGGPGQSSHRHGTRKSAHG